MLQGIPSGLGRAIGGVRPGLAALAVQGVVAAGVPGDIEVTSPAFGRGGAIPVRHTADGDGVSPPLAWRNLPRGTRMLALMIEDADAPGLRPLVHAIATDLVSLDGRLDAGELPRRSARHRPGMGRNSYFLRTYLPMDPVPGHGPHRYAFQLFALDTAPAFPRPPGRAALLRAVRGHVLSTGLLIGTHQRP